MTAPADLEVPKGLALVRVRVKSRVGLVWADVQGKFEIDITRPAQSCVQVAPAHRAGQKVGGFASRLSDVPLYVR